MDDKSLYLSQIDSPKIESVTIKILEKKARPSIWDRGRTLEKLYIQQSVMRNFPIVWCLSINSIICSKGGKHQPK